MVEVFGTQSSLELVIDNSSFAKAAKNIKASFENAFKDFKVGMKVGTMQAEGMGAMVRAGAKVGEFGGGGKEGKGGGVATIAKGVFMGNIALKIISTILSDIMQVFNPFIRLFTMVILIFLMPVFTLLKRYLADLPAKMGLGGDEFKKQFETKDKDFIDKMITVFLNPLSALRQLWDNLSRIAGEIISDLTGLGTWIWDGITGVLGLVWETLVGLGTWMWDISTSILQTAFEILVDIGTWLWDTVTSILKTALKILEDLGTWIWDNLVGEEGIISKSIKILEDIGQAIWDFLVGEDGIITKSIEILSDIGQNLFDSIVEIIKSGLSVLKDVGQNIWDSVMGFFGGGGDKGPGGGGEPGGRDLVPIIVDYVQVAADRLVKMLPFVDDFVWRAGQGATRISPQDDLIGMKDFSKLGGGGTGVQNIYYISGFTDKEAIKRIFQEIDEGRRISNQGRVSYVTNIRA